MSKSINKWLLWHDTCRNASLNMAIDEALLLTSLNNVILRFYYWNQGCVSMGYTQKHCYAPKYKELVRRISGGGFVEHDNHLTYSLIFPKGHKIFNLNVLSSYDKIGNAISKAYDDLSFEHDIENKLLSKTLDRSSMHCFEHATRYDVLYQGKKIAGSAQRRLKEGLLHQGSILLNDTIDIKQLINSLEKAFCKVFEVDMLDFKPQDCFWQQVDILNKKYSSKEFTYRR